ncbi:hypothetical protein GCM10026988_09060 [Vibrio panuliri]
MQENDRFTPSSIFDAKPSVYTQGIQLSAVSLISVCNVTDQLALDDKLEL